MWRPFFIILIITTNFCIPFHSYKLNNNKSSQSIKNYDQQDSSNPREEYVEENYSNEDSYKEYNNGGRVVIGKWRNNGEALEPKWRDGDSVPLAPFSTISFKSGWGKDTDSREEDYQIEPEAFNENGKKHLQVSLKNEEKEKEEKEEEVESNRNSKPIINDFNSAPLISTAKNYPPERNDRIRYKNAHRIERQFNRPGIDDHADKRINKAPLLRISSTFREPSRNGDVQRSKSHRETLENYPNEYELFENENDDPRPRKRRPPEHHEFPGGPWALNNQEVIIPSQSSSMANDFRRYTITNRDQTSKSTNQTKSQENTELKTFLKMQGNNLSLSEILQQKNLTLADLLRGKPNAINILKSNDEKLESSEVEETSQKVSTFTREEPESNSHNSTIGKQNIMIRKSEKNSTFIDAKNDSDIFNSSETSLSFETTTIRSSTRIEKTEDNVPSLNGKKLMKDDGRISHDKFESINPLDDKKNSSDSQEEFLKPLENRESLVTEATSTVVVEDGTEHSSSNERGSSSSNERFIPGNKNDEDEIMEFSDYPAAKMPKFIGPMLYETGTLNTRRKNVPFSAIRMRNPVFKSNIESSEKKETNDVDEESLKVGGEVRAKNFSSVNINGDREGSEKRKNETEEIKLPEKNEKKTWEKEIKTDSILRTNESVKSVEGAKDDRLNEYEGLHREEEKDLTPNHKLHEVVIPKVDPQSRAEILELFSSGSSAERLERLLASRNMTVEELIALRQRGSSQVHFAEVFKAKEQTSGSSRKNLKPNLRVRDNHEEHKENQTKETTERIHTLKETSTEDNLNLRDAGNGSGNKKKDIFESDAEYLATDLIKLFSENKNLKKNASTLDKMNHESDNTAAMNPSIKSRTGVLRKGNSNLAAMVEDFSAIDNIQRDSEGSSYYTSIEAVKLPNQKEETKEISEVFKEREEGVIKSVTLEEIGRVEEILNNDLKTIKNAYGINDYEFSEKKALSKVKPSIIASGGILGVTIVVFLSIFIACRIQQKKKFAYKNSFAKAVFHNPVMNARKLSNTSSINTIMVDIVATSTTKRQQKHDPYESDDFESKSDIDNDSLNANDSWETIPDFMK